MKRNIQAVRWLAGAGMLLVASSAFAFDTFLKVDGITGQNGLAEFVEISSFSLGVSNSTTIGSATGGAGAGKAKFDDVHITKPVDASTPKLFQAVATGKHIPTVVLSLRKEGGAEPTFETITLTDVFVTSFQQEGVSTDALPTEQVTFAYGKIEFAFTPPRGKGAGAPVVVSWDITQNKGG
jgi:type VI secretion system secreted protein Hcp